MKDYYCNGCYVGAGYGGYCYLSLPEIATKQNICPVFVDTKDCNWVEI